MRLLIEIRRIEVSFGIADFIRLCTSPQQLSTVIHRSLHRFSTFPPVSEKTVHRKQTQTALISANSFKTRGLLTRAALRYFPRVKKHGEVQPPRALFTDSRWIFILPLPEQAPLPSGESSATAPFHPDGIRSRQTASDHRFSDELP